MRSGHLALLLLASLLLGCASPGPGGRTAATPGAVSTLDPVSSQQWATDMAGFAAQDARQPPPAHPVVFTGSSSVRMWASLAADFPRQPVRSEEHTSELQSLMRISYAVFCLKKKKQKTD